MRPAAWGAGEGFEEAGGAGQGVEMAIVQRAERGAIEAEETRVKAASRAASGTTLRTRVEEPAGARGEGLWREAAGVLDCKERRAEAEAFGDLHEAALADGERGVVEE